MINPIPELTPLLKQLRLSGMTDSLAMRNREAIEHQLSYPDFLALLVQDEVARRDQKKYVTRLRRAGFRGNKTLESFDLNANPNLNRAYINELADCRFIDEHVAVLIAGPCGTGKSHLAQIWQKRTGALLVRGTQLNSNKPASVTGQKSVIVEEVEDADDRALLHVYNEIVQARKTMFLTSTVPPVNWSMVLPDLVSRISTLAVVGIGHPDDALLQGILVKQFSDRQLQVGTEVVIYLVSRMERSFEAARQIVAVLDAMALDQHRSVTVSLAGEALARLAEFWLVTDKSQD